LDEAIQAGANLTNGSINILFLHAEKIARSLNSSRLLLSGGIMKFNETGLIGWGRKIREINVHVTVDTSIPQFSAQCQLLRNESK
jgi:hypothetical protein